MLFNSYGLYSDFSWFSYMKDSNLLKNVIKLRFAQIYDFRSMVMSTTKITKVNLKLQVLLTKVAKQRSAALV